MQEWAERTVALCSNSPMVAIGIFIGTCIGGAVGGAIGAALSTPLGILAETVLKDTIIADEKIKAGFQKATIGRVVYEILRNTLSIAAAGYLGRYIGSIGTDAIASMSTSLQTVTRIPISSCTAITEMALYNVLKMYHLH